MSLDVPDLDDRTFEEIFEEARRQIPVYSDEWSDHNAHDTGIALLELLAWVSETYTYQINRITDDHREKYLQLLGVRQQPPQPSTAEIVIDPPAGTDGVVIPAGTQFTVDDHSSVPKRFEVDRDTRLVEPSLVRIITQSGGDLVDNTTENETGKTQFYAFGEEPTRGDAVYFGFDGDPFEAADHFRLSVDFYDDDIPVPVTHGNRTETFEPSVAVRWQYCTAYQHWDDPGAWADLPVAEDETKSFYRGGTVTLEKPVGWAVDGEPIDDISVLDQSPGKIWLRCVVETPGYEVPPRLNAVRLNVLRLGHRRTVTDELLRRGDETLETTVGADQEFFFSHEPVLEADIEIAGQQWSQVSNFDRSSSTDHHYVLDHDRGAIRFGNGTNGAIPPVQEHVLATRYVSGGGTEGNISKRSEWEFTAGQTIDGFDIDGLSTVGGDGLNSPAVEVEPIGPARGGADMESIDAAVDRFRRDLKRPYRATTLSDFAYLAKHTPGLRFGRTHAVKSIRETEDGIEVPEISVVVVPYSTTPRPIASEGFLAAVQTQLATNRLLTDPVEVISPTYVEIGMTITVSAMTGYSEAALTEAIREEMIAYLDPLAGFDGEGWPFGRPLYVTDVAHAANSLAGVQSVSSVQLSANHEKEIDNHGNVIIDDTALLAPSVDEITVVVVSPLDAAGGQQ